MKRFSNKLTKKNFEKIAAEVRALPTKDRVTRVSQIIPELKGSNARFDEQRFKTACGI